MSVVQRKPKRERIFEPKTKDTKKITDPLLKSMSKMFPDAEAQQAIKRDIPKRPAVYLSETDKKMFRKRGFPPSLLARLSQPYKDYDRPHQYVGSANQVHQADTLIMTRDEGQIDEDGEQVTDGYDRVLVVVDVATKYTAAISVNGSGAEAARDGLISIYKNTTKFAPMKPPKVMMQTDNGSEFRGAFNQYIQAPRSQPGGPRVFTVPEPPNGLGIVHKTSLTGRSRQTAMVEAHNAFLAKFILFEQAAVEEQTGQPETQWAENLLPKALKALNDAIYTPLTGFEIEDEVGDSNPKCLGDSCELIPVGTEVRAIADFPIDVLGKKLPGKSFRMGDARWQKEIRTVIQQVIKPGNPPLYILSDTKSQAEGKAKKKKADRVFTPVAYTKAQLQVVSQANTDAATELGDQDTQLEYPTGSYVRTRSFKRKKYSKWERAIVATQLDQGGIVIRYGDGDEKGKSTTLLKLRLTNMKKEKQIEQLPNDPLLESQVKINSTKSRTTGEGANRTEEVWAKIKNEKYSWIKGAELKRRLEIGLDPSIGESPLYAKWQSDRIART